MTNMNENGVRIYCVDDDELLREHLLQILRDAGYLAEAFADAADLYLALSHTPCDIAILDIGLPGEDGFHIATRLRQHHELGIIMLTGFGEVDDRIHGLHSGADAYLVKPVDPRELLATIQSMVRRLGNKPSNPKQRQIWNTDSAGWILVAPNNARIELTKVEREFVQIMMANAESAVSRDEIIHGLGHDTDYYNEHRLDMLISRLRQKVRDQAGVPLPLKSVRGIGFVLFCNEQASA